jgi:hypothetical protein
LAALRLTAFYINGNMEHPRLINLAIGALFVVQFCVISFKSIDMLEKQRQHLVSGPEMIFKASREFLEKQRLNDGSKNPTPGSNEDKLESTNDAVEEVSSLNHRYILFRKLRDGQGAGNIMNGLLAAHLLGQEFNRTVCVEEEYTQFHAAFEAIDPLAIKYCPDITQNGNINPEQRASRLELVNFYLYPVDECSLQDQLASLTRVIEYEGNTYPRWPRVDANFFFRH